MNKFSFYIYFILLILISNSFSNELPESFKGYKKVELPYHTGVTSRGELFLAPTINFIEKKLLDQGFEIDGVTFRLNSYNFEVICVPGPAENVTFQIQVFRKNDKLTGQFSAERLFISSTGNFYTESIFGYLFPVNKKFKIRGNEIVEIKQPYYSVNLDCSVNEKLIITSEKCSKDKVLAVIPKGMQIHVLLAENPDFHEACNGGKNYLVRTSFGLVGWINTKSKHGIYDKVPPQIGCFVDYGP
jgi:hypothetical protein